MRPTWRALLGVAALVLGLGPAVAQVAQTYPDRPVRVVVPYPPGSATDVSARILAEELRKALGQPFVVENKPGAYGILAIEEMAKSKPDGHVLMIGNVTTNGITPALRSKTMKIDYLKDVVAITRIGDVPSVIVAATKGWEPKSFTEAMEWAKANPGRLRYGSSGAGSYAQISTELIARKIGTAFAHVSGRNGASDPLNDVINGDTQMALLNVGTAAPHLSTGTLKAFAVAWPQRLASMSDVPTLAELGLPSVAGAPWQAVFAPSATPQEIIDTLHKAIIAALQSPAVQEAYAKQAIYTTFSKTPAEAKAWMVEEFNHWKKILDEVKIDVGQ